MPEKISKSQILPQKISKSQKGLQGNSSGGSQKNLKKSESASKNLKKSESASKNLKKSLFCRKKSQKVRVGISCDTFLQHSCRSYVQGGLQLRYLSCNTAVHHMSKVGCSCGTFLATQLSIMMSESQNVAKTISGWVAGESVCLRISIQHTPVNLGNMCPRFLLKSFKQSWQAQTCDPSVTHVFLDATFVLATSSQTIAI